MATPTTIDGIERDAKSRMDKTVEYFDKELRGQLSATMKAMGYRNRYLFQIVIKEAIILASMGYMPGLIVSLGLYELTLRATAGSLPMMMNFGRVIFVLLLTMLMCSISGLISVRKAMSTDPAEVF